MAQLLSNSLTFIFIYVHNYLKFSFSSNYRTIKKDNLEIFISYMFSNIGGVVGQRKDASIRNHRNWSKKISSIWNNKDQSMLNLNEIFVIYLLHKKDSVKCQFFSLKHLWVKCEQSLCKFAWHLRWLRPIIKRQSKNKLM